MASDTVLIRLTRQQWRDLGILLDQRDQYAEEEPGWDTLSSIDMTPVEG